MQNTNCDTHGHFQLGAVSGIVQESAKLMPKSRLCAEDLVSPIQIQMDVMPMSRLQPKSQSKCSGSLCSIFISSPLQSVWHDLRAMPQAKRCRPAVDHKVPLLTTSSWNRNHTAEVKQKISNWFDVIPSGPPKFYATHP